MTTSISIESPKNTYQTKNVKNIKIAKNLLKSSPTIMDVSFNDGKFNFYILIHKNFPTKRFRRTYRQTDITNYRVASLLKSIKSLQLMINAYLPKDCLVFSSKFKVAKWWKIFCRIMAYS